MHCVLHRLHYLKINKKNVQKNIVNTFFIVCFDFSPFLIPKLGYYERNGILEFI